MKKSDIYPDADLVDFSTYSDKKVDKALMHYDPSGDIEIDIMRLKRVNESHKEVMLLISRGYTYEEIGRKKGITKQRVFSILRQLSKNPEVIRLLKK